MFCCRKNDGVCKRSTVALLKAVLNEHEGEGIGKLTLLILLEKDHFALSFDVLFSSMFSRLFRQ